MKRNRLYIAVSIALLVAAVVGVQVQRAAAGVEVCTPCVVLIEVDGLEPKDVKPDTTPWLWALAHSGDHALTSTNTLQQDQAAIAAAQSPALSSNRNGFAWQAARGVMSASTAAATTSLLTGSYPEQSDVPADEYDSRFDNGTVGTTSKHYLLGATSLPDGSQINEIAPATSTLPELITQNSDNKVATFVGDPRLALGVLAPQSDNWHTWPPDAKTARSNSIPAYCPVPQDTTQLSTYQADQGASLYCPTADLNVADQAYSYLKDSTTAGKVNFAYLYLAELGAVKRIYGDVDAGTASAQGQENPAVQSQLATTDAAIGAFITGYSHDQPDKWAKTVLMVVGNHGYELTPNVLQVPDPTGSTPGMSLEQYVNNESNSAQLYPEGTYATVNVNPKPGEDKAAIVHRIADDFKTGGPVDGQQACQATGGCIDQVLYTDPALAATDPAGPGQTICQWVNDAPTPAGCKHSSWHLHFTRDGKASGSDGDLVITLKQGWAAGQLVPTASNTTNGTYGGVPGGSSSGSDPGSGQISNPYNGSAGGPRNRDIAAIVNGPADVVNQVQGSNYPVVDTTTPQDDTNCPKAPAGVLDAAANANPGDDANQPGHECQAETVDFAPSIAALLKVLMPPSQISGRFLKEAMPHLTPVVEDETLPPPPPEDPLPPPEPDIYIPPPPPPPAGYSCYDLVCGTIRAQVVDKNGCPWSSTRPGAKLDYLKIEGDFGKPASAVTLTFYRQAAQPASRRRAGATSAAVVATTAVAKHCAGSSAARATGVRARGAKLPPLKAIARFAPFKLKRGHVVLNLKIPDTFRPSHIGIYVREARDLATPNAQGLKFEAFGPAKGDIVAIKDAQWLHATKAARKRAKPPAAKR